MPSNTAMPNEPIDAQREIKAAILFYESHGWDWTCVVAYLACRAIGYPLSVGEWRNL